MIEVSLRVFRQDAIEPFQSGLETLASDFFVARPCAQGHVKVQLSPLVDVGPCLDDPNCTRRFDAGELPPESRVDQGDPPHSGGLLPEAFGVGRARFGQAEGHVAEDLDPRSNRL